MRGMSGIRRMTLSQRIGAVGCLILLTVAVPLYFIARGFSNDIALDGRQLPLQIFLATQIAARQHLMLRYVFEQCIERPLSPAMARQRSTRWPMPSGV